MTDFRHISGNGPVPKLNTLLCLGGAALLALSSCDRIIYDYEGDCSTTYEVKFTYDYNMKYADAVAHEVKSVELFIMDGNGNIVWQKTEEGDALAEEGYAMTVDGLAPGTYSLLAWAGTKDNGSFTVPQSTVAEGLTCSLNCRHDTAVGSYVDTDIDALFYGYLENQTFGSDEGTYTYNMSLIKDTNHIQLALQQTGGGELDKDSFTYAITADNANLDWDNSIIGDEQVTYYAWYTASGSGEYDDGTDDTTADGTTNDGTTADDTTADGTETGNNAVRRAATRAESAFNYVLAEFTISRMVLGHDIRLSVTNAETGDTVFSFPLLDIATLFEGYYNSQTMTPQEFLDRQDEYDITVFLDDGDRWISASIDILAWHVVIQNTTL